MASATPDATAGLDASAGHKYLAVREYLNRLVARELDVGDAIPSERALSEYFGISRMTVRQAIDTLVTEGTLLREQGRGTFVAPRRVDFEMRLTTFGEEMRRRGMVPDSKVLAAETVPCAPDVADALGIPAGSPTHHLCRVRYADGTPMSIEKLWVPVALAPGLLAEDAPASVYDALRRIGLAPVWGEETLTASEATEHEASLLDMRNQRAVMRAERRTFSDAGPSMLSRACYRGDRYSIWVPLGAPRPVLVPRAPRVAEDDTP